ncbi:carbohydrate sulfotransferase 10-like [Branchiostoma lanceolatum]|uniref:carbohydrate sulfotransferase 10-like n=1 Tax=Branchiostoma lanceolatum TaxID=7740 RepID=UPI0034568D4F
MPNPSKEHAGSKTETPFHIENKNNSDHEQRGRKTLMDEYCRKNAARLKSSNSLRPGAFFVSDKHKILYCKVGKTGSTTTSTLLYNLEFGTALSKQDYWIQRKSLPLKRLSSYPTDEQNLRINTYKTLLVVRNPLERLVSAYLYFFGGQHHFSGARRQFHYNRKYQEMVDTICWNTSTAKTACRKDYHVVRARNVTREVVPFASFIRAVTENTTKWKNEHWALIFDFCAPCQVHYDFIAHTETLANDLNTFFRNAGVIGRNNVFPNISRRAGKERLLNFYRQIPIRDILKIRNKFRPDFDMFGYSFEDDILQLLLG